MTDIRQITSCVPVSTIELTKEFIQMRILPINHMIYFLLTLLILLASCENNKFKTTYDESINEAAKDGDLKAINKFLDKGVNIESKDTLGRTPLHYAVMKHHFKIAEYLLAKGANVNIQDNTGWSPIHIAANRDDTQLLKLLISKGADINIRNNDGWTPLHDAAWRGSIKAIDILLKVGADVNSLGNSGESPIFYAIDLGHKDAVKFLAKKGAKILIKDIRGSTPIEHAIASSNPEITNILIDNIEPNEKDTKGYSALHHAVLRFDNKKEYELVIKRLIERGFEVNEKDNDGYTILDWAYIYYSDNKYLIELLESNGAKRSKTLIENKGNKKQP